ncbi:diacylglycerol kinase family lipid kinase [Bacillus sp. JRC01]|nr:diacylglycerol kinase family lipid kinase [Bacillus sp. JRC01]
MKTFYLVNPAAKNRGSTEAWERFRVEEGIIHESFVTRHPSEVKQVVRDLVERYPDETLLLVGVGGDGTMKSIISASIGFPQVIIGYIPSGSGNDFARGYNWPRKPREAESRIKSGSRHASLMDAGVFQLPAEPNGHFVNNIGIGFDALVAGRANHSPWKKRLNRVSLGKLIYPIILVREALTFQPFSLQVRRDGEDSMYDKVWFMTVSNHPYFGGGMKIAPDAHPDDGMLDVTVVAGLGRLKLIAVFLSVFVGKHTVFKEVHTFRTREMVVQADGDPEIHADGESCGTLAVNGRMSIRVLPSSWKMMNGRG